MRDYAKVAPQFWTGATGKALKAAGPEAVIVGLYLMTSPHANMIGLYYCPLIYIAHDTGLGLEGASKGLQSAIEADFCTFDAETDYVFVHAFAEYQIGAELDPKDLRVKGVVNELSKVPKGQCWQAFRARYAVPFNLPVPAVDNQAPTKPLRSQEQEQKQKQKKNPSSADADQMGFDAFWNAWPANSRKVGKRQCLAKWVGRKCAEHADAIVAHVEAMKKTEKWREDGGRFIPLPMTYLNQDRWEAPTESAPLGDVGSDAAEKTAAYLAEYERARIESQTPEAHEARKAAMAKLRGLTTQLTEQEAT
jgi:hypothetical protein